MTQFSQRAHKKAAASAARAERLAAALRDNLRRRKEQARARKQSARSPYQESPKGNGEGEPAA
jgi:hypothetical protein